MENSDLHREIMLTIVTLTLLKQARILENALGRLQYARLPNERGRQRHYNGIDVLTL